ncbi:hypothetical protein ACFPN0_32135 [Kitasatospora cinereorecta]
MRELVASGVEATMQDADPMPAEWFREPTAEELPPGSGGVHYANGRVYGWVAQVGDPTRATRKKLTIEKLAREGLDFSHFLRAKFELDDGSSIRVGAMTMNVGTTATAPSVTMRSASSTTAAPWARSSRRHERGRTVVRRRGSAWLSDWDKRVFLSCQPSYHLRARRGGGWELRAVLDVPVPGHSSPLVAAVIERSNLALAASAAGAALAERTWPRVVRDTVRTLSGQPG